MKEIENGIWGVSSLRDLLVRECYEDFFDNVIINDSKWRQLVCTGTPGIGKSLFAHYLLSRLCKMADNGNYMQWKPLMSPRTTIKLILYECRPMSTKETRYFLVELGEKGRGHTVKMLKNPNMFLKRTDVLYVFDPNVSGGVSWQNDLRARVLVLSSPDVSRYPHVLLVYFMGVWADDELERADKLFSSGASSRLADSREVKQTGKREKGD